MQQVNEGLAIEWLRAQGIMAYGTSEGAKKGWDSRGRDRAQKAPAPRPGRMTHAQMVSEHKKLVKQYKNLGERIDSYSKRMSESSDVKSTAVKFLHFLKKIGDWATSYHELLNVTSVAGVAVMTAMNTHSHVLASVLGWAYAHVAVVMNSINAMVSSSGPSLAGL